MTPGIDYEAPEPSPDDFIKMRHPNVEGTAATTRVALDEVWSKRGWEEVPDDTDDFAPFVDAPFVPPEEQDVEAPKAKAAGE